MGLGKTVQAVVATQQVEPRYTTVVCPASVQETWKREWKLWGGHGELAVISYASLIRCDPIHLTRRFDLVILDEAHYCKSPGAKRTRAALRLARVADRAWLLSGTPVPNDVRELWPPFKALWYEKPHSRGITTAFQWMNYFCRWSDSDYGPRVWGNKPAAREVLKPWLQEIMLRRRLQDVALELPPLRVTVQHLPKDPDLRKRLMGLGGISLTSDDLSLSTLRRVLGQYKATPIAQELVRELANDPQASLVVLYHHHSAGTQLANNFLKAGIPFSGFDGTWPVHLRQPEIDAFQEGHTRVFLAQQGAAGLGITLTRSHEIVLVEPSWSPADNDQAIKRIHRIGQDKPCRARIFAVPDSLDESLMATLARKSTMIGEVGL
jgi:SNF2 family DNA or RNA helicase